MNSRDIHNLQKAYLEVYQQLDEKEDSPYEKASDAALDARYGYGRASGPKTSFGRAANRSSAAAALRAIRRGERSGSGTSREAGADAVHQGWARTAKTSTDQTPEKKERRAKLANTSYSNLPDDEKEKDRVSFDAVRAIYNRNQRESYDIYDIILSHLLDEGYADTAKNAEVIMVNMSEEWRDEILESNLGRNLALGALAAYTGMVGARGLPAGRAPDIKPDRPKTEIVMPAGKTAKPPTGTRAKLGGVSGTMWKEPGTSQTSYKDTTYFKRDAGKGPDSYRTFARNDYSGKYKPLGQGV